MFWSLPEKYRRNSWTHLRILIDKNLTGPGIPERTPGLFMRPAGARSNGWKSQIRPAVGKCSQWQGRHREKGGWRKPEANYWPVKVVRIGCEAWMRLQNKRDTFPQSYQERAEGRYAGKGYRQLLIDNYIAIFKIDESKKTVHVVTVQYQGRNV